MEPHQQLAKEALKETAHKSGHITEKEKKEFLAGMNKRTNRFFSDPEYRKVLLEEHAKLKLP